LGFNKRYINNNQIIDMYRADGMQRVYDWYTKGADAIITEKGLASMVGDLIGQENDWNMMSELISDESIKKGFN
jgi:hypothetical protein|tara:strand:- start:1719 stop:1940 length:222 start_codon:yes stop_codon:yes gene_type:complete